MGRGFFGVAMVALAGVLLAVGAGKPALSSSDGLKDEVLTREERALGLATVYAQVGQHCAYLDRVTEAGWDKAFMEYLPRVEKKQSLYDYYRVLQRFSALLQDGHTYVDLPPDVQKALDWLPFRTDIVEGKWIVTQRYPTEDVLKEDIPPGSVVESIDGTGPSEYFAREFYPFISGGREQVKRDHLSWWAWYPRNTRVKVKFRYPDGSAHERVLRANRSTTDWKSKKVQEYALPWQRGGGFSSSEPEPGILYLSFRRCDGASEDKLVALIESRKSQWPKGVILDLRDNAGGNSPNRCLSHLISKPANDYDMASRWSISYIAAQMRGAKPGDESAARLKGYGLGERFSPEWYSLSAKGDAIPPAKTHYDGPLVVLIGPTTGSAAEDLVARLKQAGRGKFIGDRTCGTTGQPLSFDLPGGGIGRVCTMTSRFPDGKEFTGVGLEPDMTVTPTIRGFVEGRDEVMEAALGYLRGVAR